MTSSVLRRVRAILATASVAALALIGGTAVASSPATPQTVLDPGPPAKPSWWRWDAPGWGWRYADSSQLSIEYSSPYGIFPVYSNMNRFLEVHRALGGGSGTLGYPVDSARFETWWTSSDTTHRGQYQQFERGTIYGSGFDTHVLLASSSITEHFESSGGGRGPLGYPFGPEVQEAPGWFYRSFVHGVIYSSHLGTFATTGPVTRSHAAHGGGRGLGYPVAGSRAQGSHHSYQSFERGVVYCIGSASPSCATVKGGFLPVHAREGGGTGWLGYPRGDERLDRASGSWHQEFEHGRVEITARGEVRLTRGT